MDATLFTFMQSSFCLLLHRVSGQDDVIVGTPERERTLPETESVIGPFMNTLVLRSGSITTRRSSTSSSASARPQ